MCEKMQLKDFWEKYTPNNCGVSQN